MAEDAKTAATSDTEVEESKRIDFMIDMLMDLKNNKMRLVIDKEANVHLNNLKRTIKNYMKQRGKENIDEVRISWKDLTSEETKGKICSNYFSTRNALLLLNNAKMIQYIYVQMFITEISY